METNITSAERVLHATDIQSEAAYEKPETEPTGAWPSQGMIEFNQFKCVFLHYYLLNYPDAKW
jgi:hypothetical protein